MLTAGVDLAAEPKGTALAIMSWDENRARLDELSLGVKDDQLVAAAGRVDKFGIDCALGWPEEFRLFLEGHSRLHLEPQNFDGRMDWRRQLSYRVTDREVHALTGRWPLSVATDRLGLTAMRCAGLLSRIQHSGISVDRSGAGLIAEVYPGAALRLWGFTTKNYRVSEQVRAELVAEALARAPWLELGHHEELMIASCDALDAVIASLVTRSVAVGKATSPTKTQRSSAEIEGWIHLPTCDIAELL